VKPSIGVDIGGSKVLAAVVDETGRVLDTESTATPGPGSGVENATVEEVEDALVEVVGRLIAQYGRLTVGVAAAGFVARDGERVRFAPHLPWRDEPLAQRLGKRFGAGALGRVMVENDATAALWAEARFGAAQDTPDSLMITLGTGIGGALVVRGMLTRGTNGMAGEFGHMMVVPDGRECECGGRGCWEQYCSGRALTRAAAEGGSTLSGPALTRAARDGDPAAAAAYVEVGRWLGIGVANLVAALDPSLIVVGGGASSAGDLLLAPAREALAQNLVGAGHRDLPQIVEAVLGPLAGVVGAADLARVASRPSRVGRRGRAPSRVARKRAGTRAGTSAAKRRTRR
jgi:glucokinase